MRWYGYGAIGDLGRVDVDMCMRVVCGMLGRVDVGMCMRVVCGTQTHALPIGIPINIPTHE